MLLACFRHYKTVWIFLLISAIEREEDKVKRALKEAAKKGDKDVCVTLAKEIINARKHIAKIYTSKAHLNSIQLQMKNQLCKSTTEVFIYFMDIIP